MKLILKFATLLIFAYFMSTAQINNKNAEEQDGNSQDKSIKDEAYNGIMTANKRWTNGTVPYSIQGTFNAREINLIKNAMDLIMMRTCITFVQRQHEFDFIVFKNDPAGCYSYVGKIGGAQVVNLQSVGCTSKIGIIIHEILHALGYFHEQSRPDRDNYVKIMTANIDPKKLHNFKKLSESSTYGLDYDYDSILHYSPYAFSINNEMTITSVGSKNVVDRNNKKMGQFNGMSIGDVSKIVNVYCEKEKNS